MNTLQFEVDLLCNIAEKHLNLEKDSLNVKKKTDDLVLGRMIVCNILLDGGVKYSTLAKYFMQDRTNYYHYRKKHTFYIQDDRIYPYYNSMFNAIMLEYERRSGNVCLKSMLEKMQVIDGINDEVNGLLNQKKLLTNALEI